MKRLWIGLFLGAIFSLTLGLTRDWWLSPQMRGTWHRSWLESRPRLADSPDSLRAEHERLLAELEKEYGVAIARERAANERYRSELSRLRKERHLP